MKAIVVFMLFLCITGCKAQRYTGTYWVLEHRLQDRFGGSHYALFENVDDVSDRLSTSEGLVDMTKGDKVLMQWHRDFAGRVTVDWYRIVE